MSSEGGQDEIPPPPPPDGPPPPVDFTSPSDVSPTPQPQEPSVPSPEPPPEPLVPSPAPSPVNPPSRVPTSPPGPAYVSIGPINPGANASPPAPSAIGAPSKSTQAPLIAGVSGAVGLSVVVIVSILVCYANKKRKKTNPSATSGGDRITRSHGLSSPFPCCSIIVHLTPANPHTTIQQQATENPKPSMSHRRKDEGHGAQAQHFSPLPTLARQHLLSVVPPSPTHVPTTNNHLSADSGRTIQSFCKVFSYLELELATNGFREENFLGQGGFGYVHRGMLPDMKEIAVKQLILGSKQGDREFQAEVETIGRVHHRNLVSLVGYCMHGNNRLLVYEFIPNNTLDFHLHGVGQPTIAWSTRVKIAICSAKGVAYLHEECLPKIIHRDIKASNILLDFNYEAKVADFGLAKLSPDNKTHLSTRVMGTFGYLAPEYANSGKITEKVDVYSFGVILVELITGRSPSIPIINGLVTSVVPLMLQSLRDGSFGTFADPKLRQNYNNNEMKRMVACATACIQSNSQARPKMTQVVQVLEGVVPVDCMYNYRNNVGYCDKNAFPKSTTSSSQEHISIEYSTTSSEYGPNLSPFSSGGR